MSYQLKVCHHYIKYREATCIRCGAKFLYCPICAVYVSFCEDCERKIRKERIEKMKKLLDNAKKIS